MDNRKKKQKKYTKHTRPTQTQTKAGIDRVQALANISRSALCYHSIDTRAPIANSPNSAQLEGTPYHFPYLHPGPCSSVGIRRGTDRHTDTHTAGRDHYIFVVVYVSREM